MYFSNLEMETELEKKKELLSHLRKMKQPVRLTEIRRFGALMDQKARKQNQTTDIKPL